MSRWVKNQTEKYSCELDHFPIYSWLVSPYLEASVHAENLSHLG